MPITHLYSYLVHPGKNEKEQPPIAGTRIQGRSRLVEMVSDLFDQAAVECDIEIVFRPRQDGTQANDCRDLLLGYSARPSIDTGRAIAMRLQSVTTNRSGLGLLFIANGNHGAIPRLVLARFPADQGVVAQERRQTLDVQFIERVFMKNAKAYKCALYASAIRDGLWDGWAVDKQINGPRELTNYWIGEFLDSELRTTAASGTKRLAVAMRQAIRDTTNAGIREELLAATRLLRGQNGRRLSPERLAHDFGLSVEAVQTLVSGLPRPELFRATFEFDLDEFDRHVAYRSVELDNGGLLIAANPDFDQVFRRQDLDRDNRVRFTTEGTVVKQQLRKTR